MPFKSQAQRGYLYANEPDVAKEFEAHTPKGKKLPKKIKKKKKKKNSLSSIFDRPSHKTVTDPLSYQSK